MIIPIELVIIFFAWILVCIGLHYKVFTIVALGSILLMVMGVTTLTGIDGLQTMATQGFSIINTASGGFIFIYSALKTIKEW